MYASRRGRRIRCRTLPARKSGCAVICKSKLVWCCHVGYGQRCLYMRVVLVAAWNTRYNGGWDSRYFAVESTDAHTTDRNLILVTLSCVRSKSEHRAEMKCSRCDFVSVSVILVITSRCSEVAVKTFCCNAWVLLMSSIIAHQVRILSTCNSCSLSVAVTYIIQFLLRYTISDVTRH